MPRTQQSSCDYEKGFNMSAKHVLTLLFTLTTTGASADTGPLQIGCGNLLNHEVKRLVNGEPVNLCDDYSGKVVLIVNTASKCAFTPQYEALEGLYENYKDRGLVVLGFPSNDFGHQEPGSEQQIQAFCRMTYGVQFPMFSKSRVTKFNADPLFRSLGEAAGRYPRWNFHKFLLDRQGHLVRDFPSSTSPADTRLIKEIERLL